MRLQSLLPAGFRPSVPLAVSAASIGVIAIAAIGPMGGLLASLLAPSADPADARTFDASLARHDAALQLATDRFAGRSLFTMPPAPFRPPPPPPPSVPAEPPPPPKPEVPVAPPEYSGPKPMGMIGSVVYFEGVSAVAVGEERDGLKVIGVEPPGKVRVEHRGGTYSVPVWEPSDLSALAKRATATSVSGSPIRSASAGTEDPDGGSSPSGAPKAQAPERPRAAGTESSGASPAAPPPPPSQPATTPPSEPQAPSRPAPPPPAPEQPQDMPMPGAEVPAPLSQEEVDSMTRAQAQSALAQVVRARGNKDLDADTKDRLRREFDMLVRRIRTAPSEENN